MIRGFPSLAQPSPRSPRGLFLSMICPPPPRVPESQSPRLPDLLRSCGPELEAMTNGLQNPDDNCDDHQDLLTEPGTSSNHRHQIWQYGRPHGSIRYWCKTEKGKQRVRLVGLLEVHRLAGMLLCTCRMRLRDTVGCKVRLQYGSCVLCTPYSSIATT